METKQLYEKRLEVFQKALNRQEGDWVPTAMFNNGGGFFWGDKTAFDVEGDHMAYAAAMNSFLDNMWLDVCCLAGLTTSPTITKYFPTAENKLADDGSIVHLQLSPMKADEYDQLIADPKAFIANVLLPRKYPYLFEDREKTKELLKAFAGTMVDTMVLQMGAHGQYLAEHYGIPTVMNLGIGMINTPLDHIFDYFRGFRGTLTDLRRQPAKVHEALDVIWDYKCAPQVAKPYDPTLGLPFQPCHIPAYLSPKQFKEFYWPYEKRYAEWIAASGGKIALILEGKWGPLADFFLDAPKDSYVLMVDDDDVFDIYERLGHHQIIVGGLKMADVRLKKFDDIRDHIKKVIDTCAPGGGFIFMPDKAFVTPGDVNPTLFECYNFAHEYSKK